MAAELEDTLKRLVQNKAVIGTMVMNQDGIPIKSTLDIHVTTQYSGLINQLVDQGRVIIKINKITFVMSTFVSKRVLKSVRPISLYISIYFDIIRRRKITFRWNLNRKIKSTIFVYRQCLRR